MPVENFVIPDMVLYSSQNIVIIFVGNVKSEGITKTYIFWLTDAMSSERYIKYLGAEITLDTLGDILHDRITLKSAILLSSNVSIFELGAADNFIYRRDKIDPNNFSILPPDGVGLKMTDRLNDKRNVH